MSVAVECAGCDAPIVRRSALAAAFADLCDGCARDALRGEPLPRQDDDEDRDRLA